MVPRQGFSETIVSFFMREDKLRRLNRPGCIWQLSKHRALLVTAVLCPVSAAAAQCRRVHVVANEKTSTPYSRTAMFFVAGPDTYAEGCWENHSEPTADRHSMQNKCTDTATEGDRQT
jgi:hypothetical protein